MPRASVRLPPPLSPATTIRPASIPSAAAFAANHLTPATQSLRPPGYGTTSGAEEAIRAVAEIHHRHGHAETGDDSAPRPIAGVERRTGGHAATMDVVDAGQWICGLGADECDLDRVAVRFGSKPPSRDLQSGSGGRSVHCRRPPEQPLRPRVPRFAGAISHVRWLLRDCPHHWNQFGQSPRGQL